MVSDEKRVARLIEIYEPALHRKRRGYQMDTSTAPRPTSLEVRYGIAKWSPKGSYWSWVHPNLRHHFYDDLESAEKARVALQPSYEARFGETEMRTIPIPCWPGGDAVASIFE